jgi:hypothetical protein
MNHVSLKLICNGWEVAIIPGNPAEIVVPESDPVKMKMGIGSRNG